MKEKFLCRGKRTNAGKWIEGYLYALSEKMNPFIMLVNKQGTSYEVDKATVCQCTGLHDATRWEELTREEQEQFLLEWNYKEDRKNAKEDWHGKLIFEGDILAAYLDDNNPDDITYARVVWDRNAWCIQEAGSFDFHLLDEDVQNDYKVVGNVFDNPELVGLLEEEV